MCILVRTHFYEGESTRSAGRAVHYDGYYLNRPVIPERGIRYSYKVDVFGPFQQSAGESC